MQPSLTVAVNIWDVPGSTVSCSMFTDPFSRGGTTRLIGRKACQKPVTDSAVKV